MQFKKILSVLIPCFIVMSSVIGTSGYVQADKGYDRNDGKRKDKARVRKDSSTTRKEESRRKDTKAKTHKNSSDRYSKRDRDTRRYDSRRDRSEYYRRPNRYEYDRRPSRPSYKYRYEYRDKGYRDRNYRPRVEYYKRKGKRHTKVIILPSRRYHDRYIYLRPFNHSYPRYRSLYYDNKFWGWLAFTVVTLQILDHLNDHQRYEHERALYRATRVPIGETIIWSDDDDIEGSVTPVWEGSGNTGQYCREFKHEITIGDRTEVAYGTACKRSDGTWEIVQ